MKCLHKDNLYLILILINVKVHVEIKNASYGLCQRNILKNVFHFEIFLSWNKRKLMSNYTIFQLLCECKIFKWIWWFAFSTTHQWFNDVHLYISDGKTFVKSMSPEEIWTTCLTLTFWERRAELSYALSSSTLLARLEVKVKEGINSNNLKNLFQNSDELIFFWHHCMFYVSTYWIHVKEFNND